MPHIKDVKYWAGKLIYDRLPVYTETDSNIFAYVKGRMFGSWVDADSRDNGFDAGDLIECPVYMIESLLRDENFTERDLTVTTVTADDQLIISGLTSSENDFYNGAIYYNVTTSATKLITDYVGASKTIVLEDDADTSVTAGDNIYITNIRGNSKIDVTSFDAVGNSLNGTRKDWVFARSYTAKENINNLLTELTIESHCYLLESTNPDTGENQFKLIALDQAAGDTWTNPAYSDGIEQIRTYFTPIENVFTQFRLKYFYDYGKGDFLKEIYVDKNGYPSTAAILGVTEKSLCIDAEANYKVKQLFEYSSMNIYDDTTAEYFLQKKIQWFTKQRLIVNYVTPIVGNSDYIKYEIGDQVKLNFSKGLPTGINNTSMFMITSKRITPLIGGGYITWELIDMGELPS